MNPNKQPACDEIPTEEEKYYLTPFEDAMLDFVNEFNETSPLEDMYNGLVAEDVVEKHARILRELAYKQFQEEKEQPISEDLEEELENYAKLHPLEDSGSYRNMVQLARHFAEWQKEKDYSKYAHVALKDVKDAWQKLKENDSDIEKYPAVCFQRGADWQKEQDTKKYYKFFTFEEYKKLTTKLYEGGMMDAKKQMMKEAYTSSVSELRGMLYLSIPVSMYHKHKDIIKRGVVKIIVKED